MTKHKAIELLGWRCSTAGAGDDAEVTEWHEAFPFPGWQEALAAAADLAATATARADARAALRSQWDALPPWIRGPYRHLFDSANSLLDAGDDEAAVAMIDYAAPRAAFTEEQATTFQEVKASFSAAVAALPSGGG